MQSVGIENVTGLRRTDNSTIEAMVGIRISAPILEWQNNSHLGLCKFEQFLCGPKLDINYFIMAFIEAIIKEPMNYLINLECVKWLVDSCN